MSITVANRRTYRATEGVRSIYVGRPSVLGNPHIMRDEASREYVIAAYTEWLDVRLEDDSSDQAKTFAKLVAAAREGDIVLLCHCAPKACHADVLKARIEAQIGGGQ